jgi:hypothetical protein
VPGLVRGVVPDATRAPGEGGPGFTAPEVLREGHFSPADRFSFACVVYFVLTGLYRARTRRMAGELPVWLR